MDMVRRLGTEKPVVIFSKSTCCMCHSIKALISSFGADAAVYELDQISNGQQMERALLSMGCRPSVPAVFIGKKFVGGENEIMTLQLRNELPQMLIEAGAIWVWNKKQHH